MDRAQKAELVAQLKDMANRASIAVVSDFKGLSVEEFTQLRNKLRHYDVDFHVVRNTLAKIAFEQTAHNVLNEQMKYNRSVAFGYGDSAALAKELHEFAKDKDTFKIIAASLEGKPLKAEDVQQLAKLPSRQELLASVLGTMNAVPGSFVSLLSNVTRNFLYALQAIKEQKEDAA